MKELAQQYGRGAGAGNTLDQSSIYKNLVFGDGGADILKTVHSIVAVEDAKKAGEFNSRYIYRIGDFTEITNWQDNLLLFTAVCV